jgi:hypothetical protein
MASRGRGEVISYSGLGERSAKLVRSEIHDRL